MTQEPGSATLLTLWDGPAGLHLVHTPGSPAALVGGGDSTDPQALAALAVQPLVEILAVGHGRRSAGRRTSATTIGSRLRVQDVHVTATGAGRQVTVHQLDVQTGLRVVSELVVAERSLWSRTLVRNGGAEPAVLQAVSSLAVGAPLGPRGAEGTSAVEGWSDWVGENRWLVTALNANDGLVDLDLVAHQHQDGRGARVLSSSSTWSTGAHPAAGVLTGGDGAALAWRVEHNGPWRAEVGERLDPHGQALLTLVLLGPTDDEHQWSISLAPGAEFVTVPVSIAGATDGWPAAVAALTAHDRVAGPAVPARPWVVFNDYMNTLMGDPTTDRLLPLIDAACAVGAEVFCIDAGWYDDSGDWWDSVGAWEPSTTRFPDGGLARVLDHVRERGMVPGLWLEPEVIGVHSPMVEALPAEAFLQRDERAIVEHDRYFLDLRHRAARKHLDTVVDRLVDDYGVGYLKLDYNVTPGPGTDLDAHSVGDGLLQHSRAHLDWLDGVRARHPGLMLENCASGAMRADAATLARADLQSTSDQQNFLRYPPIAAGALMTIPPEKAASWAYPQPGMSVEEIVFTLCTGLSGRLYLSGHLDQMATHQLALVQEAVGFAQQHRAHTEAARPIWPLGLPGWDDPWVAVGQQRDDETLLVLWFRGGPAHEVDLTLPPGDLTVVFPHAQPGPGWTVTRSPDGTVQVRTPDATPQARVLRLSHHRS